ncbi:MAG: beta-ketoacyl-ACP synthase II [Bacteroidales bacterium]|jgi:3-oxoacyl-[acyl-carrier-protein] synthase II|nr:beta-ketoacyl-ACP synthase II [Bacteroidales bacterium]
MNLKKIVVTGLGALTPIGNSVPDFWNALLAGVSGAKPITRFDPEKFKTKFACELKKFDILDFLDNKEAKKMDACAHYAMVATMEALRDSGLEVEKCNSERIGVILGTGIGGFYSSYESTMVLLENNLVPRFNPFFIPRVLANLVSGYISLQYGFKGPNYVVTSACASAANAMIDACQMLQLGKADIIISGGAEACIVPTAIGGFNAMHALSTRNDDPQTASRPFDKDRDGFVMGEGAGIVILETYEHAVARGAKIYAELAGSGMAEDTYHITAPHPEGKSAIMSMRLAVEDAGLKLTDVNHINTHGTSTPLGDVSETRAIAALFDEHIHKVVVNSTKSMTGHLLGAAPAVEAIAVIKAIEQSIIPPTINIFHKDETIPDLNFAGQGAVEQSVDVALSNSFGFGGHNVTLLFKKL